MLLGAAGGLAAGALISSALHGMSLPCGGYLCILTTAADDGDYRSYSSGAPIQAPAYADSVSSSDRESLDEARREYAEALTMQGRRLLAVATGSAWKRPEKSTIPRKTTHMVRTKIVYSGIRPLCKIIVSRMVVCNSSPSTGNE
jgi:hypothetical protein